MRKFVHFAAPFVVNSFAYPYHVVSTVMAVAGSAFFIYSYLLTLSINEFDASNLVTLLMAVLVGSCLGFLPHNFHPSKILMGDTGAMLLGLVMAAAAVVAVGRSPRGVPGVAHRRRGVVRRGVRRADGRGR